MFFVEFSVRLIKRIRLKFSEKFSVDDETIFGEIFQHKCTKSKIHIYFFRSNLNIQVFKLYRQIQTIREKEELSEYFRMVGRKTNYKICLGNDYSAKLYRLKCYLFERQVLVFIVFQSHSVGHFKTS